MVSEIIQQDISLGEKWLINCKQLTEIFWTNYNKKLWKDGIYQPTNLILFLDTLNEVNFSLEIPFPVFDDTFNIFSLMICHM